MPNYWIKAYHEIIDDPKMATLPDRLWRRFMELCLLAGRHGGTGQLPDTKQLAWALRMTTDDLSMDLQQLTGTGMIEAIPNGWLVVNFAKRQAPVPGSERTATSRKQQRSNQYYCNDDVTNVSRNVTQINRIQNTESDADHNHNNGGGEIYALYENEIGPLTPFIADDLKEMERQYSKEWINDAIHAAVSNNARSMAYVKAVLVNRKAGKGKNDRAPSEDRRKALAADLARAGVVK